MLFSCVLTTHNTRICYVMFKAYLLRQYQIKRLITIYATRRHYLNFNCGNKPENGVFFPPLPRLTHPLGGNPLELLDETYPQKLEGWGYRMVKSS